MSGDWFVGQHVVCVGRHWRAFNWHKRILGSDRLIPNPVLHEIYVVASFEIREQSDEVFFRLRSFPLDCCYASDGFRPLVESQNDIAELQALLAPAALERVA